jgi:hypothetical protein
LDAYPHNLSNNDHNPIKISNTVHVRHFSLRVRAAFAVWRILQREWAEAKADRKRDEEYVQAVMGAGADVIERLRARVGRAVERLSHQREVERHWLRLARWAARNCVLLIREDSKRTIPFSLIWHHLEDLLPILMPQSPPRHSAEHSARAPTTPPHHTILLSSSPSSPSSRHPGCLRDTKDNDVALGRRAVAARLHDDDDDQRRKVRRRAPGPHLRVHETTAKDAEREETR